MSSKTIEENVVVLRFDQDDFERNVGKALGKLDELKSSLDKNSSKNVVEGLSESVKNVDFASMARGIDNISSKFNVLGAVGQAAISKLTGSAMTTFTSIITTLPNTIFKGGLQRAKNIENAKFQIEGLGEVWDETSKGFVKGSKTIREAVNNAVDGTAYGLDEAALVASQFLATGVKDVDILEKRLTAVSGVAAMANDSYGSIGRIFVQVAGQGRLMGDQLLQLSQRGLSPAVDIVHYLNGEVKGLEQNGKSALDSIKSRLSDKQMTNWGLKGEAKATEYAVREMVSAGLIDFETFSNAMSVYAEHAKDANSMYEGSLMNLNAALKRIGAKFEEKRLKNLTKIFNALIPVVNRINELLDPFIKKVTGASTFVTDKLVKAINFVNKSLGGKVAENVEKTGDIVEKTSEKVNKASDSLKKASSKLKLTQKEYDAVWAIWNYGTYGTGEKRRKSLESLGMSYKRVQDYINEFYRVGFDKRKIDYEIIDNEKEKAKQIKKTTKETQKSAKETKSVVETLEGMSSRMSPLQRILTGVSLGIRAIKNSVDSFKMVGKTIVSYFKEIGKYFVTISSGYILRVSGMILALSERFKTFTKSLSNNALNKLTTTVIPNIAKCLDMLGTVITETTNKVKEFFNTNSNGERLVGGLTNIFTGFVGILENMFNTLKSLFEDFKTDERFEGLRDKLSDLFDILKELGSGILEKVVSGVVALGDAFQEAANGNVLNSALGLFSRFTETLRGISNNIAGFIGPAKDFSRTMTGVGASMSGLGKSIGSTKGPNSNFSDGFVEKIKNIGETFEGLDLDTEKISKVGLYITGILGTIAMTRHLTKQSKGLFTSGSNMLDGIKGMFVNFGSIFTEIAASFTKMGKMFESFSGVAAMLKTRIKLESFKLIAVSVGIIAGSIAALAMIPTDRLTPAAAAVGGLVAVMFGILRMLAKESTVIDSAKLQALGLSFAGMGVGILAMAMACGKLAKINGEDLFKAGSTIAAFIGIFTIASKFSGILGKSGAGFLAMAFAVNTLVATCILLSKLPADMIIDGCGAILLLSSTLAIACRIAGNSAMRGVGLLAMSAAVGILIPTIITLSMLPFSKALKGITALNFVMIGLAVTARLLSGISTKKLVGVAVLSSVIAETGFALMMLSRIKWNKLMSAAASLSIVMLSLGVSMRLADGALKGALAMAGVMAVVGGIIIALVAMNPGKATKVAISLSALILSLGVAMRLLSVFKEPRQIAFAALALLAGITAIGLVIAALYGLTKLGVSGSGLDKVAILVEKVGNVIGSFYGGISEGILNATSNGMSKMATSLEAFVTQITSFMSSVTGLNIKDIGKIKDISSAMHDIFDIGTESVKAENMNAFVESLYPFEQSYMKFAAFAKKVPDDVVKKVRTISKSISILAGIKFKPESSGFTDNTTFVEFARQLSTSIYPLKLFYEAVNQNEGALSNPPSEETLRAITSGLTVMSDFGKTLDPSGGFSQAWTGNTTINEFVTQLKFAIDPLGEFYEAINEKKGVLSKPPSDDTLKAITSGLTIMSELQGSLTNMGGWKQMVFGGQSVKRFSKDLSKAIPHIKKFFEDVTTIKNIPKTKVENLSTALGYITTLSTTIPSSLGSFLGAGKITRFTHDLSLAIPQIKEFFTGVGKMGEIPKAATQDLADALTSLTTLSKAIPKGKIGYSDETKMSSFSNDVSALGKAVKSYVESLNGISPEDVRAANDVIKEAFNMMDIFTELSNNTSGAPTAPVHGANIFGALGGKSTGNAIEQFANSVTGIDTSSVVEKTSEIKTAMDNISKAVDGSSSLQDTKLTGDGSIVQSVKKFVTSITEIDLSGITTKSTAISNSINSIKKAIVSGAKNIKVGEYSNVGKKIGSNLAKGISGNTKRVSSAVKRLNSAAKAAIKGIGKSFSSEGTKAANNFANGLNKTGKVRSAASSLGKNAKNGLSSSNVKSNFGDSGSNAGSAFCTRLGSWASEAYRKGEYLGERANAGLKATLRIESPSKVFTANGEFAGMGFINGLDSYAGKVYRSASRLGEAAIRGTENRSYDIFGELENPVIRPVIDLSGVEDGANTISGMFSRDMATRIGSDFVSNRQMIKNQNGEMIKELKALLGEDARTNNTYNINGITYDDGSNIMDAVGTLVRAARVERRA